MQEAALGAYRRTRRFWRKELLRTSQLLVSLARKLRAPLKRTCAVGTHVLSSVLDADCLYENSETGSTHECKFLAFRLCWCSVLIQANQPWGKGKGH